MTIQEFVDEYEKFTQEAKTNKFKAILETVLNTVKDDPGQLDYFIEDGILNGFIDIEMNDGFGTEGMDV